MYCYRLISVKLFSQLSKVMADQDSTITFILAENKARGWKVALRKLLVLTFGHECVANFCAVGRGPKPDEANCG